MTTLTLKNKIKMLKSFQEMGIAVTKSVIEKIMEFMDTDESGSIDLG